MRRHDVVVIGAGLAGLRCAGMLAASGRDVLVLEADDRLGGRQQTDEVDGFLLDRGFQVLNPAYPAVGRAVDVAALDLRPFRVGVRVRRHSGLRTIEHPLRAPWTIPASLASGLIRPRDALAVARWLIPAVLRPRRVIAGHDRTLRESWDRLGLVGPLRTEVLEPFLAGVLAEDDGSTSDAFARLLARMFAVGRPALPARGIRAVPELLAAGARSAGATVLTGARATAVRTDAGGAEVQVAGGDAIRSAEVVVATDAPAALALTGVETPAMKGLETWWFAAADEVDRSGLVAVDGRRAGPVVNTAVLSRTAPTYAPPGQQLVQATCLLRDGGDESAVRRHLGEVWGADTRSWSLLRRDRVEGALPSQPAPLSVARPARLRPGLVLAGDHRTTASIQGALVSGERAAAAVLAG